MHGSARCLFPAILAATSLVIGPGCSRKFFRERADCDVEGVITQKNRFPAWAVKNWHVYPDPRARFADPFNPDRPPYPPDDYAARVTSPHPQHPHKKSGVGRVDGEGYLHLLEQWDLENRAQEPARGAPPEPPMMPLPPRKEPSSESPPSAPLSVGPTAPTRTAPIVGEWVSAKPRLDLPTVDPATITPRITEVRDPSLPVIAVSKPGEPPVPAGAVPDTPPVVLPELPVVSPQDQKHQVPKPIDPKLPPPRPIDPKPGDPKAPQDPGPVTLYGDGQSAEYLRALYSNQQGYRIKADQAVELGLINSREFQDRREDLYLAALPVTLERFNFASQAFFTEQVARRSFGSQVTGAGEFWDANTNLGYSKRLPTGAALLVQLANQVIIDLGSKKPTIAVSELSLSAIQPFLRGGGLAVNLEDLTAAERNMVYAMRSYARFRKLFYVATIGGPTGGLGLTNNPYGLQGLSVNLGRGIGGNLTAPVVGYLPLLQQTALIANQQKNVSALERLLRLYQAFREGGQQSDLQVGQVEIQLLTSRGGLLGQGGGGGGGGGGGIRGYLDSLDNFKLQLGLPLTVGLDLDSAPLNPIRRQLSRFEDVYADLARLEEEARKYNPDDPANQFRARWLRLLTESDLMKGTTFSKTIGPRWDIWAKLSEDQLTARTTSLRKERNELLDRRADRQKKGEPEPEAEIRKLVELQADLDLVVLERAVRVYEAQPWAKEKGPLRSAIQAGAFRDAFNAFYQVSLEGRNERLAITRTQWPFLPPLPVNGTDVLASPLDEAYTAGIQAALSDRLDLMNARGQVVDAYRQIAVQANSLQGVFNVQYDLNAASPAGGSHPFGFTGELTRHRLIFNAELPLIRRAERNNYRAALISYQRQRRTLMAFEDNIANDVRNDIRELRTLAELYRIQQRVVELGYSQVDNAQAVLLAPPVPVTGPGAGASDAGSAAALTQQVLQAQSSLVQAQNTLFQIWVSYLTARMNLYLDLELLQLDDRGVWNDEQITGNDNAARPVPPERKPGERLPAPQLVGPADKR
jgi:hypothetical protein